MPFASGSVTFRRFAVVGKDQPKDPSEELLQKLSDGALRAKEIGSPEDVEYGWNGGRHVFDGQFTFEHNVFAEAISFALRIDTNKVPGELKKAYQIMEEEAIAATNPSGFISKAQKKEVKDLVEKRVEEELRSGRFRRSKLVPCLWDLSTRTLYTSASGKSQEMLLEIFERSFGLELHPQSAGALALTILEPEGKRRDYEDLRPTRFVPGPDGETQYPEYPWVAKGPEPKDFLGNEFLLWLWYEAEVKDGNIVTKGAGAGAPPEVTVYFDKSLDLDCAYGMTGKDSLKADGASRMPEALDALRSGKLPRKAYLIVNSGNQFELSLNPEQLSVGGAKLPEVEDADTPRKLFEERIALLRDLCQTLDALYGTFLAHRTTGGWETTTGKIRKWIMSNSKPVTAAVA